MILSAATALLEASKLLVVIDEFWPITIAESASERTILEEPVAPTSRPPEAPITSESAYFLPVSPMDDLRLTERATRRLLLPNSTRASLLISMLEEMIDRLTPPEIATPVESASFSALSSAETKICPAEKISDPCPTSAKVWPVSEIFTIEPTPAPNSAPAAEVADARCVDWLRERTVILPALSVLLPMVTLLRIRASTSPDAFTPA